MYKCTALVTIARKKCYLKLINSGGYCNTKMNSSLLLKKRCFHSDDKFFEEGSILCRLWQEGLSAAASHSQKPYDLLGTDPKPITCQINNCSARFTSLARYEDHYASSHKNVCQKCFKILPTNYLLDIHINEQHNPMFELLAANNPMYRCLVFGCDEKFSSSKLRKKHLVEEHKYPSSFRFEKMMSKSQQNPISKSCMEVDSQNTSTTKFSYSYKVPKNFSFGHGVSKGFMRANKNTRYKKNHLTESSREPNKSRNNEQMDMKDLSNAIAETMGS